MLKVRKTEEKKSSPHMNTRVSQQITAVSFNSSNIETHATFRNIMVTKVKPKTNVHYRKKNNLLVQYKLSCLF